MKQGIRGVRGHHPTSGSRRRVLLAGCTALASAAALAVPPATSAATAAVGAGRQPTRALASPLASLPPGAPPRDTAHAIGKRVFLNGRGYDLSPYWAKIAPLTELGSVRVTEFSDIDLTPGVILYAFRFLGVDEYGQVGSYRPGHSPRTIASQESQGRIASTTGGFVTLNSAAIMGIRGDVWSYDGRTFPPPFSATSTLPVAVTDVGSVGPMFVINVPANPDRSSQRPAVYRSWIVRPTYTQGKLPLDNTYAAGVNWLATRDSLTSPCYRTAPVSTPNALRARVCSQVGPLVSNDGSKVAVVQGRHIRLYDATTGAQINATTAPTLGTWDATHLDRILRWEDASNYLVSARDGSSLYILRCNVNRTCERAVTSYVRRGASGIIT